MTRRALTMLAVLAILLGAPPAYADHSGYDEGCGRNGAGCGNEREEDYSEGGCKYCPSFQDSPIHICLPGATCNYGGREGEQQP